MQPYRHAGFRRHSGHAQDVIEVGMRQPDADGLRTRFFDLVQNQARLLAGVHNRALDCRLVYQEIAVLGEHAVGDLDDLHCLTFPSPSRMDLRYFSTAIAAVVASPTAVVICRVSWLRTSPTISGTTVLRTTSILGFANARS